MEGGRGEREEGGEREGGGEEEGGWKEGEREREKEREWEGRSGTEMEKVREGRERDEEDSSGS